MTTRSASGSIKLLYAATAALSAFLLFSIEPIITRALLPQLGGSSAVWMTALAFFQVALLAGYAYASFAAKAESPRRGRLVLHLALLAVALVSLALPAWTRLRPGPDLPPQLRLFLLLAASVGLPFLVLSTTAPLLQAWYAHRERATVPYRLFALSNLSSLLALLAYPVLVERYLTLNRQQLLWNIGFLLYAGLVTVLTIRMRSAHLVAEQTPSEQTRITPAPEPRPEPHTARTLLWFALPAVASMQLAAVTGHLTQDVASMPLLWVLPLAAYLVSFVLAFEFATLYRQGLVLRLLAVLLFALGYLLSQTGVNVPIGLSIPFFVLELLVASWFLHAELYALRPDSPSASTRFYLLIAAGGATGTLFVAVVSPLVTRSNFDLPISFLLTAALVAVVVWRTSLGQRLFWIAASALGLALLVSIRNDYEHDALLRARNFYGSIRVVQTLLPPQAGTSRILFNGDIQHGMQWFSEDFRHTPLTYYEPDSGVGLALDHCCGARPRRIGVIGLGAGTIAAYGRQGDTIRFYEINPLVTTVATHLFTYTRDTPASVSIAEGDARLTLAAEPPQHFDVLVVDAFSGDSIPIHLLTREALDLYLRHLAPGGIIAFHISNQYLDLAPVLARLAESTQNNSAPPLIARRIDTAPDDDRGERRASWVLLTGRTGLFNDPAFAASRPVSSRPDVRLWTDQYSSLLPIVRWTGRD